MLQWPQEPLHDSRYRSEYTYIYTYIEIGDCHDLSQYPGALVRGQESKSGRIQHRHGSQNSGTDGERVGCTA